MENNQIVIVAKGSGFSHSFDATNTKGFYIAKTLKAYGLNVLVLSSVHYQKDAVTRKVGKFKGIKYYMPFVFPPTNSKLNRYFHRLIYIVQVISLVRYLKKKWTKVHFIFDDNSTPFPFLLILSWLGIIELIFNLEEWPVVKENSCARKFSSHLFVLLAFKCCNKLVCVSSYLEAKAKFYNKKAEVFKLPSLATFIESRSKIKKNTCAKIDEITFLFCGNVGYSEVILTIINAFQTIAPLEKKVKLKLVLILHGSADKFKKISDYVEHLQAEITIKTCLPENDLFEEYLKASVLLAPLRLSIQDEARFPQKIAEYTSLCKPIITTYVGDVGFYFQSNNSAIFMNDFSVLELSKTMHNVIINRRELESIGHNGHMVGKKYFDYMQYVSVFGDFVAS